MIGTQASARLIIRIRQQPPTFPPLSSLCTSPDSCRRLIAAFASAILREVVIVPGAWSSSRSAWAAASWGFARWFFQCPLRTHQARACGATAATEWTSLRPGRDASSRHWRCRARFNQVVACVLSKGSPERSIACMMTASLRATATAARLKPIFSRSFRPQVRRSLAAWLRVKITTAAS